MCIRDSTVIKTGAVVGEDTVVGEDCILYPNCVLERGTVVGNRCIFQPGCVIGGDGFGFAPFKGEWVKIPQVGRVVIGDDVEIGAGTTVDRGALEAVSYTHLLRAATGFWPSTAQG